MVGAHCHQFLTLSWDLGGIGFATRGIWLNGRADGYRHRSRQRPNYHAQFVLPLLIFAVERT